MKISQAIKLGHKSVFAHKRRSLSAIIVAGILFGVLCGALMIIQGLENVIFRAHDAAISVEPYYMVATTNLMQCDTEAIYDEELKAEGELLLVGVITTCPELDIAALQAQAEKYHGKVLGELEDQEKLFQKAVKTPMHLENIPASATPVLLSAGMALNMSGQTASEKLNVTEQVALVNQAVLPLVGQTFAYDDGNEWYFAGLLPTGELQNIDYVYEHGHWRDQGNPLDYALSLVGAATPSLPMDMVSLDDTIPAEPQSSGGFETTTINYSTQILEFSSFAEAYDFAVAQGCVDSYGACELTDAYDLKPLIGDGIRTAYGFQILWLFLNIAKYVIVVIALVIMLITGLKVLTAEAKTIQLYRSLGASRADVNLIYGWYLLEFAGWTVGFALVIGLLMAGIMGALNSMALADMLTIAYAQPVVGSIVLMGWNWSLTQVVAVMLLVAPVCLLLGQKVFRRVGA